MTRTFLIAATACALAFAAPAANAEASADTLDLSAQQQQKCPKGGCKPAAKPARPQVQQRQNQQRTVQPRPARPQVQQRTVQPRPARPQVQQRQIQQRNVQPRVIQQQNVQQRGNRNVSNRNAAPRALTFRPNRQTYAFRVRAGNSYAYRGRNYSLWRQGPWRHRYGNRWRTYVAIGALSAIAVAGATYYPYAYIDAPADVCEGETADGCQLVYDEVETVDGTLAPACVTYCPQQ